MRSYYHNEIVLSASRLLGLQNRNPSDPTAGSFSKNYWHFKTTDLPSSTHQMGLAILAKLWALEDSPFYQQNYLLEQIYNGIRFLERIQKKDGSFDEWYTNERGWAGPTGYVMNACLDAFEILRSQGDVVELQRLRSIIEKGIHFLCTSSEGHPLANHIAIAILPLMQAKNLLSMQELTSHIQRLLVDFKKYWNNDEGWSLEYDGADPGYQSATLSFFSKCLRYERVEDIQQICLNSLDFISYFTYPSGYFAGSIGSRHTCTMFYAGVEHFRDLPLGSRLSSYIEDHLNSGLQILPSQLDDHYFIYRLNEFLDADRFVKAKARNTTTTALPWETPCLRKSFPLAGLEVGVLGNKYWICSLARGGNIRIENIASKQVLLIDNGINATDKRRSLSSLWQGNYQIRASELELVVEGQLVDTTPKTFSTSKLIIFRMITSIFGIHHRSALWIKNLIRMLLMVNQKPTPHRFRRKISIQTKGIEISTTLFPASNLSQVEIGGEFWTRYVPQSRYFSIDQMTQPQSYKGKDLSDTIHHTTLVP